LTESNTSSSLPENHDAEATVVRAVELGGAQIDRRLPLERQPMDGVVGQADGAGVPVITLTGYRAAASRRWSWSRCCSGCPLAALRLARGMADAE
jgi:hypothetical protein